MKEITKFNELKFNLTENMTNIIIEILIIKELLNQSGLSKREIATLNKNKDNLLKQFKIEFQKNNIKEINKYYEIKNND